MNVVVVIQARMGSTRLPGKVLLEINGISILEHIIRRVEQCKTINKIIVATSENEKDDIIKSKCSQLNVTCIRGSENNVLKRYIKALNKTDADAIIRLTADCPLIDYRIIDNMVKVFIDNYDKCDYMSNFDINENTFPRGMDVEIISRKALIKTYKEASKEYELEHVTPYIYTNPDKFNLLGYSYKSNESRYRLTLDTKDDFVLINEIYTRLSNKNKYFSLEDIIELIENEKELFYINNSVVQKKLND